MVVVASHVWRKALRRTREPPEALAQGCGRATRLHGLYGYDCAVLKGRRSLKYHNSVPYFAGVFHTIVTVLDSWPSYNAIEYLSYQGSGTASSTPFQSDGAGTFRRGFRVRVGADVTAKTPLPASRATSSVRRPCPGEPRFPSTVAGCGRTWWRWPGRGR